MYLQYEPLEDYGQHFAYNKLQAHTNVIDFDDPAKLKILKHVLDAFEQNAIPEDQPGLRIDDVCNLSGFKEGFVRDRLGDLVEQNFLSCISGSGRRPAYYFPPDHMSDAGGNSISHRESVESMQIAVSGSINPGLVEVREKRSYLQNEISRLQAELDHCNFVEEYLLQLKNELSG